jgi:hypothetical protein
MKRRHIKEFQAEQYKKADIRIKRAAYLGFFVIKESITTSKYYFNFSNRYQII